MKLVVAVYCYACACSTYLPEEPLTYFSDAGPYKENILVGNRVGKVPVAERWRGFLVLDKHVKGLPSVRRVRARAAKIQPIV